MIKLTWVVIKVIMGGVALKRETYTMESYKACGGSGLGDRWPHQQRTAGDMATSPICREQYCWSGSAQLDEDRRAQWAGSCSQFGMVPLENLTGDIIVYHYCHQIGWTLDHYQVSLRYSSCIYKLGPS